MQKSSLYKDETLIAHWEAKKFNITVLSNDELAGVITGTGSYDYKSTVKLSAEPNDGYNFVGWFDDNGLISSSVTYEFQVYRDKTISVLWNYYTITTSINIMDAGSISMFLQTKISVGKRVDLQATVND